MYVIKYCGSQEMELKKQFYSVCNLLRFFYSYFIFIYCINLSFTYIAEKSRGSTQHVC